MNNLHRNAVSLLFAMAMLLVGFSRVSAGAIDGPRRFLNRAVYANNTRSFFIHFRGNALARVSAYANQDNQGIEMEIYDSLGNLVIADHEPDSTPICVWYPKHKGIYRIKIINHEVDDVMFDLYTN